MILTQCAACAKPLAHDAPRCIRCWTRYCDASCQLEHWSAGHKKQCKKIARGGGAEQFYADAKANEAAEAAVVECRPNIPADAICYICRENASREGLVTKCGCHGIGIAHLTCLVRQGRISVKDWEEGEGSQPLEKWQACDACGQDYLTATQLALAWACWKTYQGRPQSEYLRSEVMEVLGYALVDTDAEAALRVLEAKTMCLKRFWPHDKRTHLNVDSLKAQCYKQKGQYDEVLRIRRSLYSRQVALDGKSHKDTIHEGCNAVVALIETGSFAEAQAFGREQLRLALQAMGRSALSSEAMSRLAEALIKDPNATRADLLEAEALFADGIKISTCVSGPRHPDTLADVSSLALVRRKLANIDK